MKKIMAETAFFIKGQKVVPVVKFLKEIAYIKMIKLVNQNITYCTLDGVSIMI